jgi:hypothetical protein
VLLISGKKNTGNLKTLPRDQFLMSREIKEILMNNTGMVFISKINNE